ncbi:endospore germination permease [Fictibacillus aquaticus]|uniref:GerAB/ArcD/ProY family transporter n=1 Tax=Fictibacillus aquaticus TaxID=2021314 RepID=UPI0013FDB530|nr:endospore germination permease [Fictibacillus aquaticus]
MLEKGKISVRQFTILVALYTIGTAILIIPSILAAKAKQDAWISGLLGLAIGVAMVIFYWKLSERFQYVNLIEILEKCFGKWIGKSVGFLFFVCYVLLLATFVLRDIGDFMTTVMMVETPIEAIHIIFLIIVLYGVKLGLEVFTRTMELFIPWIVLLLVALFLTLLPQIEVTNILPVFENGMKPIVQSSFSFLVFPFLEMVVFLMIIPYVNRPQDTKKAFMLGTIMGGGLLIFISVLTILVVGPTETARSIYPTYDLTKTINIREFFQRVEALMALIWFITVFVKLLVLTYVSCLGIAQVFELKEYRIIVLPIGLVLYVLSLSIFPSISFLIEFTPVYDLYAFLWCAVFPFVVWLVSLVRGGERNKSGTARTESG